MVGVPVYSVMARNAAHFDDSGIGPAVPADWDCVYAQELPRVHAYFCGVLGSAADPEYFTTRTFESAWPTRQRYRTNPAAFAAHLQAIAQEMGGAAAHQTLTYVLGLQVQPSAAFAARLRAHLQALEFLERHHRGRRRLY